MKIGFIGTGNMGSALIRGYSKSHNDTEVYIFDKDIARAKKCKETAQVTVLESLNQLVEQADIIVIAVKPNIFDKILPAIKNYLNVLEEMSIDISSKVFVSIAAGISIDYMKEQLGQDKKIVRVMPNLNSLVGLGMTGVSRDNMVNDTEFSTILDVFQSVGKAVEVDEKLMDTVVGISGSSPAYVYMFIDAMAQCAIENGMDPESAKTFAAQSTLGAAVMVLESGIDTNTLVDNVCSPGGTTIEGVKKLRENGFADDVKEGMTAVIEKSKSMTK